MWGWGQWQTTETKKRFCKLQFHMDIQFLKTHYSQSAVEPWTFDLHNLSGCQTRQETLPDRIKRAKLGLRGCLASPCTHLSPSQKWVIRIQPTESAWLGLQVSLAFPPPLPVTAVLFPLSRLFWDWSQVLTLNASDCILYHVKVNGFYLGKALRAARSKMWQSLLIISTRVGC